MKEIKFDEQSKKQEVPFLEYNVDPKIAGILTGSFMVLGFIFILMMESILFMLLIGFCFIIAISYFVGPVLDVLNKGKYSMYKVETNIKEVKKWIKVQNWLEGIGLPLPQKWKTYFKISPKSKEGDAFKIESWSKEPYYIYEGNIEGKITFLKVWGDIRDTSPTNIKQCIQQNRAEIIEFDDIFDLLGKPLEYHKLHKEVINKESVPSKAIKILNKYK